MSSDWREHAPEFLAGAAAVTPVVSIVGAEIFLGLALVALLASGRKLRWPPVTIPVVLWIGWTLVSLAASGHAASGFPQVKKFIWFPLLLVIYSSIRSVREIRMIALGWAAAATLSSLWGFEQYVRIRLATQAFFDFVYNNNRITGFMGHWMTLSGHLMMALMFIGAMLLFSKDRKWSVWLVVAGAVVSVALLLANSRSMWGGAAAGAIWLLWFKKKWLVLLVPALAVIVLAVNPFNVRQRVLDLVKPRVGMTDSTTHRYVLRRVGWEMIKAHPWVGVGPEQVLPQFHHYIPADVPQPIPTNWYLGHLHNIYFHYAAERGVPALLALLWILFGSLLTFSRALRRLPKDSETRWVLHGVIAATIAVMVSGYWELNLGDSEVLAMFLSVLACGFVAAEPRPEVAAQ